MYKISLIVLLTSPLVFNVPVSRAQTFSPKTIQTLLLFWSNSNLRSDLDKLCVSYGARNAKLQDGVLGQNLESRSHQQHIRLPERYHPGRANEKTKMTSKW
uniref:Putative secreted protein n=1 Tax=Ixodes ricinus TaxID=34613 RepID=A0A090X9F3_IXORI